MMQEIGSWLVAGLIWAASGLLYWLIADQMIGHSERMLAERLTLGIMIGLAIQVIRRLRQQVWA